MYFTKNFRIYQKFTISITLTQIFDKSLTVYIILQTNHWQVRFEHLYLYTIYIIRRLKVIWTFYPRTWIYLSQNFFIKLFGYSNILPSTGTIWIQFFFLERGLGIFWQILAPLKKSATKGTDLGGNLLIYCTNYILLFGCCTRFS